MQNRRIWGFGSAEVCFCKKTNRIIVFWSFLLILKRFQCILLILLNSLQFSRFERICSIKRFEHLMHPEPKYKFLRVIDLCLCWI